MLTKELKELKESHWLWKKMSDDAFELMNDEFDKHAPLEENSDNEYYMLKAIEREHTKGLL